MAAGSTHPDSKPRLEAFGLSMVSKYVVLVCGLNIRDQNRMTLNEQRLALRAVANELDVRPVGDKGSYAVASRHDGRRVVELVLGALAAHRPDLKIPGAAVASPAVVADALAELARLLALKYGRDFNARDHGINLGDDIWRAGLALPLCPMELPATRSLFHKTKNAMVFGWTPGGVLLAKRQAQGVHWGTTVTDPAWRLMRRLDKVVLELTSRSANVLRDLVG